MCHVSHVYTPMTKQRRKDTASQDSNLAMATSHTCNLEQVILLLWMSVSPMAKWGKMVPALGKMGRNKLYKVSSTVPGTFMIRYSLSKHLVHVYYVLGNVGTPR